MHEEDEDFVADSHHVIGMVHLNRFIKEKKHVDKIRECALAANISLGDDVEEFENAFNVILNGFDEILISAVYLSENGKKNRKTGDVDHVGILNEGFLETVEKEIFKNVRDRMDAIERKCIDILKPVDK